MRRHRRSAVARDTAAPPDLARSAPRETSWIRSQRALRQAWARSQFPGSVAYWEKRYALGKTSGAGSYGEVARFKADVLNGLVSAHHIESVLEFGCGDGNQLSLAHYPTYVGLDVSATAIQKCTSQFADDESKSFLLFDPRHFVNHGALTAELVLSLDVIYHLVEDDLYERHLTQIFESALRMVAIFAPDTDGRDGAHVRFRQFTPLIEASQPLWHLVQRVANPLRGPASISDFFIYERLYRV